MLEHMDKVIDRMHYFLCRKKKIYLHCINGISVSPAILIYYLMMHKKMTYDRSHDLIKKLRPDIDVDSEFENQLRIIEEN